MLITFEGIDASGKSTQMDLLANALEKKGLDVVRARQPGGTTIGRAIREILLNPANIEMVPETEVLLYVADRLQHIKQVIKPALRANKIVLCDRYHEATVAYQGSGRQLDLSWLNPIHETFIPTPDLTLYFDLSVETSQLRLQKRNTDQNIKNCRLEQEDVAFFNRIRTGYQKLIALEPHRFEIIDAEKGIETIQNQATALVLKRLQERS